MSVIVRPRRAVRGPRLALALAACLGVVTGTLVAEPLYAYGEVGTSSGSGGAACPSPNPPNTLALIAGTPQTAALGTPFATGLQVALANTNGCAVTTAVAGIPVTFRAPASSAAAGGVFSASGSGTVTVGSDASGTAAAPSFTANDTAGSYEVTASSGYGAVQFSLTNAAARGSSACGSALPGLAGRPARVSAGVGATQSAPAGTYFPIRLAVTVTDAEKSPVRGALVTFSAPTRGPSGHFASRSRGSRPRSVKVRTDACGIAVAPAFAANDEQGGYVVKAGVGHARPAAFALVNTRPGQQP